MGSSISWLIGYLSACLAMFRFYFKFAWSFDRIHPNVANGKMFPPRQEDMGTWNFDASFAQEFESSFEQLKHQVRQIEVLNNYNIIFWASHGIRWVTAFVAVVAPRWALMVGAVQFLIAPFSLPICIIRMWAYLPGAVVHYMSCLLVGPVLGGRGLVLTMGPGIFGAWMAIDQILNFVVYFRTSEPFGARRLAKHILLGTLNTKVYYVVAFGCLQGLQIDLLVWVVVSFLSMLVEVYLMKDVYNALGVPAHEVRFYVDHRICHLPGVYAHAHKMHHHMHDTTPWDGFLYGSALNEQYLWWYLDVVPCWIAPSLWILPYCFSGYLLEIAWTNKTEHTRTNVQTPCVFSSPCVGHENYHADHHTLHLKNISLEKAAILDFYFGTQGPQSNVVRGCSYTREEEYVRGSSGSKITVTLASAKMHEKST